MSSVPGVVAVNTFREAVRDRVLYNLIFFALIMIGTAILVGPISIGIERMVIVNLGLSAISLIGLVMAVFIGVGLVSKEIEKRTLYSLLAKPIYRWQFLAGKYAGLLLTLVVNTALMTVGLGAALFYVGHPFVHGDLTILTAIYFILLELALVTALAMLFSCYSSPILSTLFTLGVYVTGIFAKDIRGFGDLSNDKTLKVVTRVIYYVVPNFHNFNAIAAASHGEAVAFSLIWQNTIYAAVYVTLVLLAATAVFSGRDLK
jgi:ABC-type transport system involved in multi-copper enzyme maturation permease subunit